MTPQKKKLRITFLAFAGANWPTASSQSSPRLNRARSQSVFWSMKNHKYESINVNLMNDLAQPAIETAIVSSIWMAMRRLEKMILSLYCKAKLISYWYLQSKISSHRSCSWMSQTWNLCDVGELTYIRFIYRKTAKCTFQGLFHFLLCC